MGRSQGWRSKFEVGDEQVEVPATAGDLFSGHHQGTLRSLWVWPDPDIEVIFRRWSPDEIVGDVSLFEVQGQERLDTSCEILRLLGQALGKQVALHAEADRGYPPILAYDIDQDRVVFLAGPWIA